MSDDYTPTLMPQPEEHEPTRSLDAPVADPAAVWAHTMLNRKLFDRYEVLGYREGGFGVVYRVEDMQAGREYAVKTYKPELADQLPSVEEFKAEVEFWIKLDPHPNIVKAHFVEVDGQQPYLFMDHIGGAGLSSVRDWLQAGAFGEAQAIDLIYQLCLGMEFANSKGEVAHLDLKPENLLLERTTAQATTLKITDFGLARRIRTMMGNYPRVMRGTWVYAAPEQIVDGAVDARSDIYATGVIFYEMLTGRWPYPFRLSRDHGEQYNQMRDFHAEHGSKALAKQLYWRGLPELQRGQDLAKIISTCLTYHGERWRDFSDLREILEATFGLRSPTYVLPSSGAEGDRSRAQTLQRIGRHSDALTVYNRLLQQQPGDVSLWVEAAHSLLAINQPEDARGLLREALRLDPGCEEARRILNGLFDH